MSLQDLVSEENPSEEAKKAARDYNIKEQYED